MSHRDLDLFKSYFIDFKGFWDEILFSVVFTYTNNYNNKYESSIKNMISFVA